MSEKLAKLFELPFFSKEYINRFFEKLVLSINKSIEAFTLFQKSSTRSKSGLNIKYKAAQIKTRQLRKCLNKLGFDEV